MADSIIVAPASKTLEPLEGLDSEQRQVAESLDGPLVVLAGAGTGKTRAITHRIAYGVSTGQHDPVKTLALTFTTRAAGEMTRRLALLGVEGVRVRTFHSAALRQLRWAWPSAIGGEMHEVIASKSGLIASAAASNRISSEPAMVRDLATEIEWAKSLQVGADDYQRVAQEHARRSPAGLNVEQAAAVYASYERAKRNAKRIDFEDVLLLTIGVLDEHADLRRTVQKSFRHFTVDEFQDVSGVQQRLLDLWLGDRDDVCVVGDVAQTIYSFAGANPAFLRDFARKYKNATTIALTRCYRCTPQIVDVAEHVIGGSPTIVDVRTGRGLDAARRLPLRSQTEDGPPPRLREYSDEPGEAAGVVAEISSLIATGVSPREIAILVRINAVTEAFESALADAGIAYSVRGARRFFDRPEVKMGVSLLRGALRAASAIDMADPADVRRVVRAILGSSGWTERSPSDTGAVRDSWESMAALVALADEVCARNPAASLRDVIDEIARREEAQDAPSIDGVTLASLHAAKGMEWEAVFLVGLVDGVMPMSHAVLPEQVEEERRLLYVGITRTKRHLSMSWARARIPGGRGSRKPSRFLIPVMVGSYGANKPAYGANTPATAHPKRKKNRAPARCRVCGKALVTGAERSIGRCRTCPSSANEGLLERLRQWRSGQVAELSAEKGKSLPPYLVATDATLEALAELSPTTMDELASIPGLGPVKLEQYGEGLLELLLSD